MKFSRFTGKVGFHRVSITGLSRSLGFSLVELIVVIAILAILTTLVIPAVGSLNQSGNLNRGGQALGDQIILARQEATAKNRDVEVRLIQTQEDSSPGYRAVQLWLVDEAGLSRSPIGKVVRFPNGIIISEDARLSPLLTADTSVSGTANFGGNGESLPYKGFRIRSKGSLENSITMNNNFLTVIAVVDTASPPQNFYTIRVNPINARVTTHRP